MKKDREFFYTDFNTLGSVMNDIVQNSGLRYGVKKATLFRFWNKVAGKKFEKYSRIESLSRDGVLTVACANASVSSELLMFKQEIIKKINTYANPLNLQINDIKFSHKIWNSSSCRDLNGNIEEEKNPYKYDLSGYNPDNIILDKTDVETVRVSVETNKFATQQQRERMFNAIINDLKVKKYLKDQFRNNS